MVDLLTETSEQCVPLILW